MHNQVELCLYSSLVYEWGILIDCSRSKNQGVEELTDFCATSALTPGFLFVITSFDTGEISGLSAPWTATRPRGPRVSSHLITSCFLLIQDVKFGRRKVPAMCVYCNKCFCLTNTHEKKIESKSLKCLNCMTGSDLILKGWKISSEFKKRMYVKWCIHGISNQHPIYLYLNLC